MAEKFSKWVENTMGKGEIAHYEQFLLFLQCFKRLVLQKHKKQRFFGTRLNYLILDKSILNILKKN